VSLLNTLLLINLFYVQTPSRPARENSTASRGPAQVNATSNLRRSAATAVCNCATTSTQMDRVATHSPQAISLGQRPQKQSLSLSCDTLAIWRSGKTERRTPAARVDPLLAHASCMPSHTLTGLHAVSKDGDFDRLTAWLVCKVQVVMR
jgi:hypothetical protein